MIFRKRTTRGKTLFAKEFSPWTPFQKTPIRLRRGSQPVRRMHVRTRVLGMTQQAIVYCDALGFAPRRRRRQGHHILGVLCGGSGGRFSRKKEPPGLLHK